MLLQSGKLPVCELLVVLILALRLGSGQPLRGLVRLVVSLVWIIGVTLIVVMVLLCHPIVRHLLNLTYNLRLLRVQFAYSRNLRIRISSLLL